MLVARVIRGGYTVSGGGQRLTNISGVSSGLQILAAAGDYDGRGAAAAPFVLASGTGVVAASSGAGFASSGQMLRTGEWIVIQAEPTLSHKTDDTLLPSPSCMLNNESCPIPRGWDTDWSVINSTALMAVGGANDSPDGFNPKHRWGYVTLDWSVGWRNWIGTSPSADPAKTTCEATSSDNCVALKKAGKVKRCGIYHDMELALQWLKSERVVMDEDHVRQGWFLTFPNGERAFPINPL